MKFGGSAILASAMGVVLACAGLARADVPSQPAPELPTLPSGCDVSASCTEARQHFVRGSRLVDIGHYDEAIRAYEASYERHEDPALLYDLAVVHRLAGHPAQALRLFELYLRRAPDADNRAVIEQKIAELRRAAPIAPALVESGVVAAAGVMPNDVSPVAPLVERAASRPTPVYKRGWFIAVMAGAVAVTAAGVAVSVFAATRHADWATSGAFGPGTSQ